MKYRIAVEQHRVQHWTLDIEADSETEAKEIASYGFDDEHGYFIEDTEGLEIVEDTGVIGDYGPLMFLSVVETE